MLKSEASLGLLTLTGLQLCNPYAPRDYLLKSPPNFLGPSRFQISEAAKVAYILRVSFTFSHVFLFFLMVIQMGQKISLQAWKILLKFDFFGRV